MLNAIVLTACAEWRCAECHCAECRYAECHCAECRYAEYHFAECQYAECHCAECHCADSNATMLNAIVLNVTVLNAIVLNATMLNALLPAAAPTCAASIMKPACLTCPAGSKSLTDPSCSTQLCPNANVSSCCLVLKIEQQRIKHFRFEYYF